MGEIRASSLLLVSTAMLLLLLEASAVRLIELPIATTEENVLDFFPGLNASCEMKFLQDDVCCSGSTFNDASEAGTLLVQALRVFPTTSALNGTAQTFYYESGTGLQVGTRSFCDEPLGSEGTAGLGCRRCLLLVVNQILSRMLSQTHAKCRNAWALRFGYIFEPDSPWDEDTTWCHLDYWFRVLPSTRTTVSSRIFEPILALAHFWNWNSSPHNVA